MSILNFLIYFKGFIFYQKDQCDTNLKIPLKFRISCHIVLDGLSTGTAHPVHLHGNRYYVVKYGVGVINETSGLLQGPNQDIEYSPDYRSAKWRNSSWNNGNIPDMNVNDPPLKDTVVIPYKGYVVLRLKTENPGIFSTFKPDLFCFFTCVHVYFT